METNTFIEKPRFRALKSSFFVHELPLFIEKIKNDCGWKMGDLKSLVVVNEPDLKVVLTAFHPKTEINSTQQSEATVIHVIDGALKLRIYKNPVILSNDQKFTIYDKTRFKLEALTETLFLIIQYPPAK